jgi:hypothetical protein
MFREKFSFSLATFLVEALRHRGAADNVEPEGVLVAEAPPASLAPERFLASVAIGVDANVAAEWGQVAADFAEVGPVAAWLGSLPDESARLPTSQLGLEMAIFAK